MIRELSQEKLFVKRRIRIFENKVSYNESKLGRYTEFTVAYEDLTNFKETYVYKTPELLWGVGVSFFFFISSFVLRNDNEIDNPYIWILFGFCFIAVSAFYFITYEKVWKIKSSNYVCIYIVRTSPDKKTVDDFIEELFNTRREYLRDAYFYIDKNLQYEPQLRNLQWLKRTEAITKDEFEAKREELSVMFNTEKKTIGFSK